MHMLLRAVELQTCCCDAPSARLRLRTAKTPPPPWRRAPGAASSHSCLRAAAAAAAAGTRHTVAGCQLLAAAAVSAAGTAAASAATVAATLLAARTRCRVPCQRGAWPGLPVAAEAGAEVVEAGDGEHHQQHPAQRAHDPDQPAHATGSRCGAGSSMGEGMGRHAQQRPRTSSKQAAACCVPAVPGCCARALAVPPPHVIVFLDGCCEPRSQADQQDKQDKQDVLQHQVAAIALACGKGGVVCYVQGRSRLQQHRFAASSSKKMQCALAKQLPPGLGKVATSHSKVATTSGSRLACCGLSTPCTRSLAA